METTSSFGYWLRRQRKALDLTQQVLAERVGCSLAAIKKIEGDERRPSRQIAERLADVLGVPDNQREVFLEVARGLRSVDQLSLAQEAAVSSPPTGTVTFLYTDIEGSTKMAQDHPKEWETVRARHHAILHETIKSNNGYVFEVIGDGFCASFYTANDGLHAAIEAQRKLQTENWGDVPLKVRMGLHTGEAEAQGKEYRGYLTISLVQRLMSAGHGEQILLSHATENLLRDHLPQEASLLDLGENKLKDILQPVHVFQVITPGLRKEFPALRALDIFPNNLPVQLTSFIGREHELSEIKQLLTTSHLLTLTGPGGTGKTRLALQLGAEMLAFKQFANGVWLVELAPLADPTLVTQTIAATLGVREQPGRTILDALMDYTRAKKMLLILDNCEHLIETSAQLANNLLRASPELKILATSREALGIAGETAYRVPSLPLPEPQQHHDLDMLSQNECVRLFIDRALTAYPRFHFKEKNARAIADICRRLDGIPLAIELAAARTKVFPPEEIAARLDDRFRLLTGGSRTALERHQTLFALIEWSHNLLSEPERVLLRRLSVFAGGWSFQAAQEVCGEGPGNEVLELLTHLVDKSLVSVEEDREEARYRLPETIRQYARDKLFESGESEQVRDRHLEFFIHLAEGAEPRLRSAEQLEWLERLETEHDNLRIALAWSLESGGSDRALQLAGALYYFWELRGYWSEGGKWLDDALALSEAEQQQRNAGGATRADTAVRARALHAAGRLRGEMNFNLKEARPLLEESLRLWRERGDKWWIAATMEPLAVLLIFEGDLAAARARLEEGILLAREIEARWPLALCLIRLAGVFQRTDLVAARQILEEGVAVARNVGDKNILSLGLLGLGSMCLIEGNYNAAASFVEESLAEARATGGGIYAVIALYALVVIRCQQGELEKAKSYCFELLALGREKGSLIPIGFAVTTFGFVASVSGQPERAVRLLAVFESMARQVGLNLSASGGPMLLIHKMFLEKAQAQLSPDAFQEAWAEGQQMTLEQALALALEDEGKDSPLPKSQSSFE